MSEKKIKNIYNNEESQESKADISEKEKQNKIVVDSKKNDDIKIKVSREAKQPKIITLKDL